MSRLPPSATRTDTLIPDTKLFRSDGRGAVQAHGQTRARGKARGQAGNGVDAHHGSSGVSVGGAGRSGHAGTDPTLGLHAEWGAKRRGITAEPTRRPFVRPPRDRKSTRLNSSH